MNYTKIEIDGKTIGLKFGMASFRYLQGKMVDGISFIDNSINEIGIAQILYSGYYNNCLIKEEIPVYKLDFFVDYIEKNINNEDFLNELKNIITIWSNNDFIKTSLQEQVKPEAKKKIIRGKK
jgi:hypothetical protein